MLKTSSHIPTIAHEEREYLERVSRNKEVEIEFSEMRELP